MTKTMTEEITLHSPIGRDEQGQYCKACNHRYGYAADRALHQRASAHIAEVLSAAGFGLVADAKAEALASVKQVMARLNNEAINANEGAKYAAEANDGASLRALEAERFAYQLAHRLLHVAIRADS